MDIGVIIIVLLIAALIGFFSDDIKKAIFGTGTPKPSEPESVYDLPLDKEKRKENINVFDLGIDIETLFAIIDYICFKKNYIKAGRIEFRNDSVWYKTGSSWTGPLTLIASYNTTLDSPEAVESIAKAYYDHKYAQASFLISQGKETLDIASYDTYDGYGRVNVFWELKW